MKIGDRVKELRQRKALTQEQLAEAVGRNRSTISMIEANRNTPQPGTIRRLADNLGVPPEALTDPDWSPVAPKASAPSSHSSEETDGAKDELRERLALIQDYKTHLQAAFEGLDERLKELRKTRDRKALSSLSMLAFLTYLGADAFLEDDEDLQEHEGETLEEVEARGDLMRTFLRLGDLSDEIDEDLNAQEEPPEVSSLDEKRREVMRQRRAS